MFKNSALRLSVALVLWTVNLLFLANLLGLAPDETKSILEVRKALSESLALQFCAAAEKDQFQIIQNTLREVVERNEDIESAAVRTIQGKLIALAGEHLAHWDVEAGAKSTPTHVQTLVYRKGEKWATVEIRFAPLGMDRLVPGFPNSFLGLLAFIGAAGFVCYFFILKRSLRILDPSAVIPERVQKAFNVLQEGVLILDEKEQIVMANKSFARLLGKSPESMIGMQGSELVWMKGQLSEKLDNLPWIKVMRDGKDRHGNLLTLKNFANHNIKLSVSASMVTDKTGTCRGCLATFDDITELEEKNFELKDLVAKLQASREEIESKSRELEFMATRDPLTHCLNRRSLERMFNELFGRAQAKGGALSCLMVDIDFFKSVNDRFGHAVGDQVIQAVGAELKRCTRGSDLVSRYGGEEFCVVLKDQGLERATQIAERIRQAIAERPCGGIQIAVSIGVAALEQNAATPDELTNQADKALYLAKRAGRNRVLAWNPNQPHDRHALPAEYPVAAQEALQQEGEGRCQPVAQPRLQERIMELEALVAKKDLEFEHYAMYDTATGLATRAYFEDRIRHEIARSRRTGSMVIVLLMSIDTVKRVDATLGQAAALQMIKACARRMNAILREDIDTIAMIAGHERVVSVSLSNQAEFGILLTDIKQVDHATWVVKRLLDAFSQPFEVQGQEIYTAPYIGVSLFPLDSQSAEELYGSALQACNFAKQKKQEAHYLFASQAINDMAIRQLQIESLLHEAIENDELQLHFQPKVEAASNRCVGFEALLRWRSERLGAVSPGEFIPVAERSGQIDRLGDWVIHQACKQIRQWLDLGFAAGSVAVNLSAIQLRQINLADRIKGILQEFDLPPARLEIELTESSLVNYQDKSFAVLKQIRALGIRVSMDDFGTGYSSLAYLKNLPLNCVKIDRSFVNDIGKDEHADRLVASIVSMAHGLGLDVVAEGVEKPQQAAYLKSLGCEYLQGFLYGRPLPQTEVIEFAETRRAA